MRVVFDYQACQSESRFRGIGRASRSLQHAMAKRLLADGHDVVFLLNHSLEENVEAALSGVRARVPGARAAAFRIPAPCAAMLEENAWRQSAARALRELAIAALRPDFVHVPALLADGWGDDAVGSVGELGVYVPVALTQHDLIPLVMQDAYLAPGPFRDYYFHKLDGVKRAELFLAISEYTRGEAVSLLGVEEERVINVSSAVDDVFLEPVRAIREEAGVLERFGLSAGFFLYAPGGFDIRKNVDRLFRAFALLPADLRARHPMVLASRLDVGRREVLSGMARSNGLGEGEFVLTDFVSDRELVGLYRACQAYVFPSLHEGFGLPVLEAMACGAPVIGSNCTGIPEAIGLDEALFDPRVEESIADKMRQVVEDESFRERLLAHGRVHVAGFSWERSAAVAIEAMYERNRSLKAGGWVAAPRSSLPTHDELLLRLSTTRPGPGPTDFVAFRECYDANIEMGLM